MLQYGFVYIFVLHWNPDSLHMCSGGWRFESDIYHVRIPLPSSCLTFFLKCKLEYQSDFATNVAHLLVLFPLKKKTLDLSQDSVKLGSCCYFYTCINLPHSMQTSAHIRSGKSAKTIPDFLWFVRVSLSWLVIHFFLCSLSPCCTLNDPIHFRC